MSTDSMTPTSLPTQTNVPPATQKSPAPRRKASWRVALRRDWPLYAMAVPPLIFLFIFRYLPMAGNAIAFRRFRPGGSIFGEDFVENNTVMISLINANSPMVWDDTMVGALKTYARSNQAVICTPFILAGAMAPCTVAGTMTQTLAESLAGMALAQLVRPGAPVVLGSFASSMSMQSGAPTFGMGVGHMVSIGAFAVTTEHNSALARRHILSRQQSKACPLTQVNAIARSVKWTAGFTRYQLQGVKSVEHRQAQRVRATHQHRVL